MLGLDGDYLWRSQLSKKYPKTRSPTSSRSRGSILVGAGLRRALLGFPEGLARQDNAKNLRLTPSSFSKTRSPH